MVFITSSMLFLLRESITTPVRSLMKSFNCGMDFRELNPNSFSAFLVRRALYSSSISCAACAKSRSANIP